jgi:hypothetical protein
MYNIRYSLQQGTNDERWRRREEAARSHRNICDY